MQVLSCVAPLAAQSASKISKKIISQSPLKATNCHVVVCIAANTHAAVDTLLSSISLQWPAFMKQLADLAEKGYGEGPEEQRVTKSVSAWMAHCKEAPGALTLAKAVSIKGCGSRPAIICSAELPCQVFGAEEKGLRELLPSDDDSKERCG